MICQVVSCPFPPSVPGTRPEPLHVRCPCGPHCSSGRPLGRRSCRVAPAQVHFTQETVRENTAPSQASPVAPYFTTRWATSVTPLTFKFPNFVSSPIPVPPSDCTDTSSSPLKAQAWLNRVGAEHTDHPTFSNSSLFLLWFAQHVLCKGSVPSTYLGVFPLSLGCFRQN